MFCFNHADLTPSEIMTAVLFAADFFPVVDLPNSLRSRYLGPSDIRLLNKMAPRLVNAELYPYLMFSQASIETLDGPLDKADTMEDATIDKVLEAIRQLIAQST